MTNSNGDIAVSVRDLHVRFRVYSDERLSMRELFARRFRSRHAVEVHAVRAVSFDVRVGEIIGVIGSNGSGKSTLLRCIAGLQAKSAGSVFVRGDVRLLGVQAALKPRLSGHHNVILGGLAMGLDRADIESRLDEVVAFSGVGAAIRRPMDTYSSGMRARLAFSIATLQSPEILLLDEALAVGDREFRERSLHRIDSLRQESHTVFLVSHNLQEISSSCSRTLWMDDGVLRADGPTEMVLDAYASSAPGAG